MRKFVLMILAGILATTFSIVFPSPASAQQAGQVFVITAPVATLYLAPAENRKSRTVLNRGRRVEAAGPAQNGFIPISTRGTSAFVRAADVTREASSGDGEFLEAIEPSAPRDRRPAHPRPPKRKSILGLEKLTFDLGVSSGSYGGVSYTEVNLGLNAYFKEWLAWRNAIFGRFISGAKTIYGLDSSVRGILDFSAGGFGATLFAGPGYRVVNEGRNVPFGEAGLVIKLGGFNIGGGAKVLLNSWVESSVANDTQYFIILAGGGSL